MALSRSCKGMLARGDAYVMHTPPVPFPPRLRHLQDAVRNGKSPPCRVAQIWRRVPRTRRGRFGGTWHDRKSNTIVTIRPKKSTVCGHMTWTVGAGVRGKGSPFWEREALGRFVQGGMVFVGETDFFWGGRGAWIPPTSCRARPTESAVECNDILHSFVPGI